MKLTTNLACTTVLFLACATSALAQSSDPSATLTAWVEAYASQDGACSAALYSKDASLWGTASSKLAIGRAAISEYFGRRREGVKSISVTFDEQDANTLGDGIVVTYGKYTFRQQRSDGTENIIPARFSMVLAKGSDGVWLIAHHHSSPMPKQ